MSDPNVILDVSADLRTDSKTNESAMRIARLVVALSAVLWLILVG
jgi:hypothetical protein